MEFHPLPLFTTELTSSTVVVLVRLTSARPSTAMTDSNISAVQLMIETCKRRIYQQIRTILGIGMSQVHPTFHEHLPVKKLRVRLGCPFAAAPSHLPDDSPEVEVALRPPAPISRRRGRRPDGRSAFPFRRRRGRFNEIAFLAARPEPIVARPYLR
ncbi:hypothetical protein EVAR_22711_1 [Eumeta japonica]|uniref:Uncharacterized protein n=1 Tax=Eumeta variegata TaxID=151549 RepID=A0A4C1USQ0_EUMVA|nr:hypothetical protein EVAR_22711_1 [Eumeta japonica]